MTSSPPAPPAPTPAGETRSRSDVSYIVAAVALPVAVGALLILRPALLPLWEGREQLQSWLTVLIAIVVQSLPFLLMGVVLSAFLVVYVPPSWILKVFPRNSKLSVPLAGLAGFLVPGCECASVPLAKSLITTGVAPAAACTFLLAAPAINPVVLIATGVAYNGDLKMVVARAGASLLAAMVMGVWVAKSGRATALLQHHSHDVTKKNSSKLARFVDMTVRDFMTVGGFLVIGAAVAATMKVVVPRSIADSLAGNFIVGLVVMAIMAVIVAICSEADAFVAIGFSTFSPAQQLAFMVVGPMVDVKLIAMQIGAFGKEFALRFAPVTFLVALMSAGVVGFVGWMVF